MNENLIVENSRHYFNNCKAAFRLLQGSLLSGHVTITNAERDKLEEHFVTLEKGSYNLNDPSLLEVQEFFSQRDKLADEHKEAAKAVEKINIGNRKVLVIDDQYRNAGWKEIFEKLFGSNNVVGFREISKFKNYLNNNLKTQRSILSIFVDLNFSTDEIPNGDGITLLHNLAIEFPSIPLIAFTAYDSTVWVKKAFDNGAWDYFSKNPNDKEAKEYKHALEYYSQFVETINRFSKYNYKFSPIYDTIFEIETFATDVGLDTILQKKMIDCLWMAFRYSCLDYVIRFSPGFFDESKEEEIVFQSSKGFEFFIACIFNKFGIKPTVPHDWTSDYFGVMLKPKIDLLEANEDKLNFSMDWYKQSRLINTRRNKNTHGDTFSISKKMFVSNPSRLNNHTSVIFFKDVLRQISSGLKQLKANGVS